MEKYVPEQETILRTLQDALPHLLAVYVFGSHAQGTAGPDSDLDLAVLVAGKLDPVRTWELAQTLASQVRCDVDLIDLRAASTVMQYEIITKGVRLWERDVQVGIFECMVLSEMTELDTARAGLLADIQREGSVYGRKAQQ